MTTDKTVDMSNSLKGLQNRRELCRFCIYTLDQMSEVELETFGSTDEKRKDAMTIYKGQLASIDAQITKITGTPPPVVVGLKTAKLFGIAENIQ